MKKLSIYLLIILTTLVFSEVKISHAHFEKHYAVSNALEENDFGSTNTDDNSLDDFVPDDLTTPSIIFKNVDFSKHKIKYSALSKKSIQFSIRAPPA